MITPALSELQGLLATEDGQKAYIDWISHPVTQKVIAAGRELARPKPLGLEADCHVAYGESMGANNLLDFIASPVGANANKMRGVLPPATYGVKPTKENTNA